MLQFLLFSFHFFLSIKAKLKQIVRHLQLKEVIQRARSQSKSDDGESSGYGSNE